MQPVSAILSFGLTFIILGCGTKTSHDDSHATRKMADGHEWLVENLKVKVDTTYCSQDDEKFCLQYGRLYTWQTAKKACSSLGDGWRLPTDNEWQTLAKSYGGIYDDSNDEGKTAYVRLISGGESGFNALLGGNREVDGSYQRREAHGFYWTSSGLDSTEAWFYNFAKSPQLLNHHTGDKKRANSVRCIRD
ncbi:MAG TPA: FISUMP domain-containing protein [Cyclobacteriaceae bacterium]|jgi:uncharacterized protein (TIGR02145 family)|nr:FISUMP domain-containing protein [Cyclobacteriaceae bacterium]